MHFLINLHLICSLYLIVHLIIMNKRIKIRAYRIMKKERHELPNYSVQLILGLGAFMPIASEIAAIRILYSEILFCLMFLILKIIHICAVISTSHVSFSFIKNVSIGWSHVTVQAGTMFQIHLILLHWTMYFPNHVAMRKMMKETLIEFSKQKQNESSD